MSKARALFLVPEAPYPVQGGGALRSAGILEYLAHRYHVDVIVFQEPGAANPAQLFPAGVASEIHVLELPLHAKDTLSRTLRNTARLLRGIPPLVDRFSGFGPNVSSFVSGRRYQVAVVEHFWCAPYWNEIAPVSAKTVLNLHNIESVLHARCAGSEAAPKALAHMVFQRASRDLETYWLPRYDCLLTTSDADADLARTISPSSRVIVHCNSIPMVAQPGIIEEEMIAFSGNLEYHPNISAVRFFHDEIWPRLRDRWPALVWRLIGKNPGAVAGCVNGDARIQLSGPVQDAIEQLAAARAVVVPLLAGSGTRFKVIEAWAAGRAVVSTRIGAEGLPVTHGENILLADDPAAFAEAVSSLLESPDLRQKLGQAGRTLFEAEFTWENTWKKLDL